MVAALDSGNESLRKPIIRTCRVVFLALALTALPTARSWAGTLTVNAASDAVAVDDTGTGVFTSITSASGGLDIRNFASQSPNFERRSIVYFSTFTLPTNVTITSVILNYGVAGLNQDISDVVNVFGFQGGSSITTSDATSAATSLPSFHPWPQGLGNQTLDLGSAGISLVQTLSGSSSPLALRFQGASWGVNTLLYSIENNGFGSFNSPSLTITFESLSTVPEPSSIVLSAVGLSMIGLVCVFSRARSGLGGRS
ncbi:MAG: hypothetical protein U0790_07210 [Isosphaeraceae bacterium]